jgi:uncharacterized protein (TIGR00369 family)
MELTEMGAKLYRVAGILHDGAIMTLTDTLGALATFANLPKACATRRSNRKPIFAAAPADTLVKVKCTPFYQGKSTMVWQTRITTAGSKLSAVVTPTQIVLPK